MGEFGESPRLAGEGRQFAPSATEETIVEKKLTFEEASRCLNTLGKDETGSRYAYLMITAADSKLTDASIILNFKHVLFLDLSGNYLTLETLSVLAGMPFLILLKAERNRVESAALPPMHYLQVLDLNQNQIKDTGTINQPLLDCLEMNFNDIYETQFEMATLSNLKQLEMRSNLLFDISGVYPESVEKLYLAANKITSINPSDFSKLVNLQILHLRENNLEKLDGFTEGLINLKYINLRNNKIKRTKEFGKLQVLPNLEVLIVIGNPLPGGEQVQKGAGEDFGEGGKARDPVVIPLLVLLPKLKRINKTTITVEDRIDAEDVETEMLGLIMDEPSSNEGTTTDVTTDYKTESESERQNEYE